MKKFQLKHLFPPLLGMLGIASIFLISNGLRQGSLPTFQWLNLAALNTIFSSQLYELLISLIVLLTMYLLYPQGFRSFFRWGNKQAMATPMKWLGVKRPVRWKKMGMSLSIIISSGTLLFMIVGLVSQQSFYFSGQYLQLLPLALLFSLTNAWSEEIFTRFTVVAGLAGKLPNSLICWISAAIFGIPHYFGMPGGFIGVLMAGLLGWLLAKSVLETRGMLWAFFIHFIQDVIIFSAMMMMMMARHGN